MKKLLRITAILAAFFIVVVVTGCTTMFEAVGDAIAEAIVDDAETSSDEPQGKQDPAPASSGKQEPATAEKQTSTAQWDFEMEIQAQIIFSMAFTGGGFWLTDSEYKEGEYTIFEWDLEGEDSVTMEKAFLTRSSEGEWWRVAWNGDGASVVYEALLSRDRTELLALRADDGNGRIDEIKLSGQVIYTPAELLESEEIESMSKGNVAVTTPAGRFQAKHLVFSFGSGPGKVEWWVTEKVPGSVVKYQFTDTSGSLAWSVSITEYGKNARTILESY